MKQNKLLCSQKCRTLFYGLQKFDGTIYHFFSFLKNGFCLSSQKFHIYTLKADDVDRVLKFYCSKYQLKSR